MTWPHTEIEIDDALVTRLVRKQFPELAERAIVSVGEGFDNSIWRLGNDLVARLPRRMQAVVNIENELTWLPIVARDSPIPTPLPMREGKPDDDFPWPWLIARWIDGTSGLDIDVATRSAEAAKLGAFARHIHSEAPLDAPFNPYRSASLDELDPLVRSRLAPLAELVDEEAMASKWDSLRKNARSRGKKTWIHGDLHPGNTLYESGQLVAVIDFGDLCAGDPATDLAGALLSFDQAGVRAFLDAYGDVDQELIARALCWTFHFSLLFLHLSQTHPVYGPLADLGFANIDALSRGAM